MPIVNVRSKKKPGAEPWRDTVVVWAPRVWRQRVRYEGDWMLTRWARYAYTLKALVCLLLWRDEYRGYGPEPDAWTRDEYEVQVAMGPVAHWDHPEFGDAGDFDYLAVGHGILRGWYFRIGHDGWP